MLGIKILWKGTEDFSSIGWLPNPVFYYEMHATKGVQLKIMSNGGESTVKIAFTEANLKEIERLQALTAPVPASEFTGNTPVEDYYITIVILDDEYERPDNEEEQGGAEGGYLVLIDNIFLPDREALQYARKARYFGIHWVNESALELIDQKDEEFADEEDDEEEVEEGSEDMEGDKDEIE